MDPLERDELLYGDPEPAGSEWPVPEDAERVSYHLRKAVMWRARAEQVEAEFEAEIARLGERRDSVIDGFLGRARRHEQVVEGWHRREYAAGRAAKTLSLPGGVSKLRRPPPAAEVLDEEALRAWAVANDLEGELWPAKEPTFSRSAAKKLLEVSETRAEAGSRVRLLYVVSDPETGEVVKEEVPGLVLRVSEDRHSVGESDDG